MEGLSYFPGDDDLLSLLGRGTPGAPLRLMSKLEEAIVTISKKQAEIKISHVNARMDEITVGTDAVSIRRTEVGHMEVIITSKGPQVAREMGVKTVTWC